MLKRRFANSANHGNNEYRQLHINDALFCGYVCLATMRQVTAPLMVPNGAAPLCVLDEGYRWLLLYPENRPYAITAVFDAEDNLVEWYFDVAQKTGTENGIPYEDDLFLDVVIEPCGAARVLDADELNAALAAGVITQSDVAAAWQTVQEIETTYGQNPAVLQCITAHAWALLHAGEA